MIRHSILALWLLFAPAYASAQVQCDAIIPLSEIHAAMERIAAPGHRRVNADFEYIRRTLLRLDTASVAYTLRDHPLASQTPAIGAFLDTANAAVALFAQDRYRGIVGLQTPAVRDQMNAMGLMLRRYPCLGAEDAPLRGIRQLEGTGLAEPTNLGVTREQALLTLALSLILTVLCIIIIRRQIHRLKEKRRRQKRFYVKMSTTVLMQAARKGNPKPTAQEVQVVDISCEGAKILHELSFQERTTPTLSLRIEDKSIDATVVWHNPHFAGLRFHNRLGHGVIRRLVRTYKPGASVRDTPARPVHQT